jgi:hypothetical protein
MFPTWLKEQDFSWFENHLRSRLEAEDADLPDNETIELVIKENWT